MEGTKCRDLEMEGGKCRGEVIGKTQKRAMGVDDRVSLSTKWQGAGGGPKTASSKAERVDGERGGLEGLWRDKNEIGLAGIEWVARIRVWGSRGGLVVTAARQSFENRTEAPEMRAWNEPELKWCARLACVIFHHPPVIFRRGRAGFLCA